MTPPMSDTITGAPSLESLSEAVPNCEWTSHGRYIGTANHMSLIAECRDENGNWSDTRISKAKAAFIARLASDYFANRLHTSEALAQAVAAAREETDWQDMSTAPRDGRRVLLFGIERPFLPPRAFIGRWDPDRAGGSWVGPEWRCIPTHWMPLPAPPTPAQTDTAPGGRADG